VLEEDDIEAIDTLVPVLGYDSTPSIEGVSCNLGDEEEGRLACWEDMVKK
jgi:hypothetical protein